MPIDVTKIKQSITGEDKIPNYPKTVNEEELKSIFSEQSINDIKQKARQCCMSFINCIYDEELNEKLGKYFEAHSDDIEKDTITTDVSFYWFTRIHARIICVNMKFWYELYYTLELNPGIMMDNHNIAFVNPIIANECRYNSTQKVQLDIPFEEFVDKYITKSDVSALGESSAKTRIINTTEPYAVWTKYLLLDYNAQDFADLLKDRLEEFGLKGIILEPTEENDYEYILKFKNPLKEE